MTVHSASPDTPGPNAHAWRYALLSAAALWLLLGTVLFAVLAAPFTALSFLAPMVLGAGVVALAASRLPLRLPVAAYPLLVLVVATAVNLPLLDLLY
jgi:hypothetical protein